MNKNLLIGLAVILLVVLGYFALQQDETIPMNSSQDPHGMVLEEQSQESPLELIQDNVDIKFNELYPITDEWSVKVIQFEPDAKINGPGIIQSDSDQELNPAAKIEFYKNDELIHYQICFKEMPGFHSVKEGQEYLIDLMSYDDYKKVDGKNTVNTINVKIWRIK